VTGLCQDEYKSYPVDFLYPRTKYVELLTNQPLTVAGKPYGLGYKVLCGSSLYSWVSDEVRKEALAAEAW
jgi:hypothetical protein